FISLEILSDWGWIAGERIAGLAGRSGPARFEEVEERKLPLLHEAAGNFLDGAASDAKLATQWVQFEQFCRREGNWLNDYAMYALLRTKYRTGAWTQWPEPARRRDAGALAEIAREQGRALALEQVL